VFMWGVNHAVSSDETNFLIFYWQRILPQNGILCLQINELSLVQVPPMFLPEDFKAYSKIRVDNHLFNR
jgi:hypothetical protein